MNKVKVEKDVFVRDKYNVRARLFVAGQEVDEVKYNEAFRLNVPVDAEALPKEPVFVGNERTHGVILPENREMFVHAAPKDEKPKAVEAKAKQAEKTEVVGEPVEELEAQKGAEEVETKTAKTGPVKAKK